jgi:hypothetical protein
LGRLGADTLCEAGEKLRSENAVAWVATPSFRKVPFASPASQGTRFHCSANQTENWRTRLGLSTTVLSLLVALISVLTASVPVLKDLLEAKEPRFISFSQGFELTGANDQLSFHFLVLNMGNMPGTIVSSGSLRIGKNVVALQLQEPKDAAARVIEPGKNLFLTYIIPMSELAPKLLEVRLTELETAEERLVLPYCTFYIGSVTSAGTTISNAVHLPCSELSRLYLRFAAAHN